jgi:DNA primase
MICLIGFLTRNGVSVARISDSELERLKVEVSLVALVEAKGVVLRKHGGDLVGRCLFHDDQGPSFVVSPLKNLWRCHGACQAGGSVVDFVMRAEGVSFRHAVELLRHGAPVSEGKVVRVSSVPRLPSPLDHSVEDRELLSQVVGFYGDTLRESVDALAFLERRKINDVEAVASFRLGFADRTLGYRLPDANRKAGASLRGRLQTLGVIRPSGHELFRGSLVVPIFDANGDVAELYGRKINDNLREGTAKHLYLPGPHRGVWNHAAVEASDEVIVTESLIDALTFWCAGFRNVTAAYGVEGFTADHWQLFRESNVRRVLLAFDADPAGDKAAVKLSAQMISENIEVFRVEFPKGFDANDVAVQSTEPADVLGRLLRRASWMGAGAGPKIRCQAPEPVSVEVVTTESAAPVVVPAARATKQKDAKRSVDDTIEPPPVDGSLFVAAGEPVLSLVGVAPKDSEVTVTADHELVAVFGGRRWRVRGLGKVTSFDALRVNVLVSKNADGSGGVRGDDRFHVDTLDLYSSRARVVFAKSAADELGVEEEVVRRDLGRVLLACEEHAEAVMKAASEPVIVTVEMTDAERAEALTFLRSPDLLERVTADFVRVGMVGEATNCLVGYLAAISRKLDRPLAVIVQSTSAAGKSALMEAVLGFVPHEELVAFSAMTGQSLFYMGERDLAHKVLAIAEEEGAERAAYALKLLQSEGRLSIASTGKDNASGRLVTHTYEVSGPTAIILTTTAIDVDEELLNRCLVLTVDEARDQTRLIHDRQRRRHTLNGLLADQDRDRVVHLHQNAQRLLDALPVVIPMAEQLTFSDGRTRTRRDHPKYLALISAVALLHQHQRPRRTVVHDSREVTYIEATMADVEAANVLAVAVLGQSLDELPPQTRRLLELLDVTVTRLAAHDQVDRSMVRFTRRRLREELGWGDTQLKVHLGRLVDLELVSAHRVEHGQFLYELAWNSAVIGDGGRFIVGLSSPNQPSLPLDEHAYDGNRLGQQGVRSGSGRAVVGGWSAPGRPTENGQKPNVRNGSSPVEANESRNSTDTGEHTESVIPIPEPTDSKSAYDLSNGGGNPERSAGAAAEKTVTQQDATARAGARSRAGA